MIEKKCCDNKGNVEVYFKYNAGDCCGCQCECIQPGILNVTVGEGGDFATLREAFAHVNAVAANSAQITFVSNVIETIDQTVSVNSTGGGIPIAINGNGHTLDLSNVTKDYGLVSAIRATLSVTDLIINAPNVKFAAVGAGNDAYIQIRDNVKIIAGGQGKTQWGISVHNLSKLIISGTGNSVQNCLYGIRAHSSSFITVVKPVEFVNVTNQYLPTKNTVGSNNSYIDVWS